MSRHIILISILFLVDLSWYLERGDSIWKIKNV